MRGEREIKRGSESQHSLRRVLQTGKLERERARERAGAEERRSEAAAMRGRVRSWQKSFRPFHSMTSEPARGALGSEDDLSRRMRVRENAERVLIASPLRPAIGVAAELAWLRYVARIACPENGL